MQMSAIMDANYNLFENKYVLHVIALRMSVLVPQLGFPILSVVLDLRYAIHPSFVRLQLGVLVEEPWRCTFVGVQRLCCEKVHPCVAGLDEEPRARRRQKLFELAGKSTHCRIENLIAKFILKIWHYLSGQRKKAKKSYHIAFLEAKGRCHIGIHLYSDVFDPVGNSVHRRLLPFVHANKPKLPGQVAVDRKRTGQLLSVNFQVGQ